MSMANAAEGLVGGNFNCELGKLKPNSSESGIENCGKNPLPPKPLAFSDSLDF